VCWEGEGEGSRRLEVVCQHVMRDSKAIVLLHTSMYTLPYFCHCI
jgi:hypothetical protein